MLFVCRNSKGSIVYAYEKKWWDYTVGAELFLELYSALDEKELPYKNNRGYSQILCQRLLPGYGGTRIAEGVDPSRDFAVRI